MRKFKRMLASFLMLFVFLSTLSAYAEVLGTHTSAMQQQFAQGTTFYTNTFQDATVGKQTEHYITYTPNPDVTPILTNGSSIYGKRNLMQANQYLTDQGLYTAMGVNADFFSLQTGVPMSNVIINKRVVSKDSETLSAIGFYEDGSAFIGSLPIETTMKTSLGSTTIECINKYRQPYALYLFTSDFGPETYTPGNGILVVLKDVSGEITLGSSVTAVVESIDEYDGSVAIPKGKWILSVSAEADQSIKDRLNILEVGSKVTFTTKETGNDPRWKKAVYGLGALGGKLLTDGKLDYTDDSAAPRTAVGIKKDGTVVFYTIDGRKKGYSYGVRKETLAKRLLELGCVDAINLDGGGSTTVGGTIPGTFDFEILNRPSDGSLRQCANFFFLKKNNAPSGVPYILEVSDWGTPVLSGSSIQLTAKALDSAYGPADTPDNIRFTLKEDAGTPAPDGKATVVQPNGRVIVRGNGDVYIQAKSGSIQGETMLRAVATPGEIKIFHADTKEEVTALTLEKGQTLSLTATAYWFGQEMVVDDGSFTWRTVSDDADIGTISEDGKFTASENSGATGVIGVNAGLRTYEIPVEIEQDEVPPDPVAYPTINGKLYRDRLDADISSPNGLVYTAKLYIDGSPVSFQYDAEIGKLSYAFPQNFANSYHRITLTVTDASGASAMESYNYGNLSGKTLFPDTKAHWARDYIAYLADRKVVNGSDDGTFRPNDSMTRTEFAIMLCNYLGIQPEEYQDVTVPFTDADEIPWWAENHVKAIYSLGIMQGQLTDYGVAFNPNANIQRLEYAISIERLLPKGLAKAPITAIDENDIPYWGKESLKMATAQNILNGYPDGSLRPRQSVTRAEAVKILYSVFGAGK
ncbi:MAG: S-layer homology domain-containing protein [Clostridia bacterium]|nr:S-layer homology domain-containing protein [Clostridia bacterium]